MTRDPLAYLEDIRQSLKEIAEFTKDMKFEDFASDKKTINAVVRSLEVSGEAAKNIPEEFRYRHLPRQRQQPAHAFSEPVNNLRLAIAIQEDFPYNHHVGKINIPLSLW